MRRVITFELRTWAKNEVEETHLVDVSESISKKVLNRDRHADPVLCDFMRLIEKLEMAKSIPTDSDTRPPPGGVFDKTSVKESPWQRSYRSRRSASVECFEPRTPWNGAAATIRPNSPLIVSRDADTPNELGENRKNRYSLQATNSRCCMEISRSRSSSGSRCVVSPPKDKTGDRDDNQQDRRDGHPISYPSELMRPSPVLYRWRVRARLTRLGLERLG